MKLAIEIVDAFTQDPFSGNPAAVCFVPADTQLPDNMLTAIAREMNLSETAFVQPLPKHTAAVPLFSLRWFTPTVEVNLCGHATLATAHALLSTQHAGFEITGDVITFQTLSGELYVKRHGKLLQLDFPQGTPQPTKIEADVLHTLVEALGITEQAVMNTSFCARTRKLVLEVGHVDDVLRCKPDFRKLMGVSFDTDVRGVIVTTSGLKGSSQYDGLYDFVSRYFAPWNGIDEDPVTGTKPVISDYG